MLDKQKGVIWWLIVSTGLRNTDGVDFAHKRQGGSGISDFSPWPGVGALLEGQGLNFFNNNASKTYFWGTAAARLRELWSYNYLLFRPHCRRILVATEASEYPWSGEIYIRMLHFVNLNPLLYCIDCIRVDCLGSRECEYRATDH